MHARLRLAEVVFLVVTVAVLLFNLGETTAGVRIATEDDRALAESLRDPVKGLANQNMDFGMGRIYSTPKFQVLGALMREPSDTVHSALRCAAFFLAMLAAAWFTREWRGSGRVAWLVLCVGVGLAPVSIAYQALISYPLLWLGWAGVWTMGALALREESVWGRCGMVSAFAFALFVHESNAAFLIWPAMLRWSAGGRGAGKAIGRELLLCGSVLVAYGAFSLWLRHAVLTLTADTVYEGGKLSLRPVEMIYALNIYTWSGLPGLDSWVTRTSDPSGTLWMSAPAWLHRAVEGATPLVLVGAVLVGFAIWRGTIRDETTSARPRAHPAGIFVALCFASFAPNLLLALTVKYQMWAHQRMWPYYYTSMSYLAWVVLLVGAAFGLLNLVRREAAWRAGRAVLAAAVTIATVGISGANREAAALLRRHTFFHMNQYRQWFPPR